MQFRRHHRGFTPAAIADLRHRYEDTDEPQSSIAADYGVHRKTIESLAKAKGWTLRKDRAQRDVPPDLRLAKKAARAVQAHAEASVAAAQSGVKEASQAEGRAGALAPARPSVADRLERAVEKELAAVEIMRATLGSQPQPPADAERMSRILERLTDTLFKVRRLRSPDSPTTGPDDFDDWPRDIDEFRRKLARRIEAFVQSRTGGDISPAGDGSGATPPRS